MTTELASLALAIDSRPAVDAASALDRMADAATRGESRVRQIQTAADALIAALNRNTAATEALTVKIMALEPAAAKASVAVAAVGTAADSATSNVVKFDRATGSAKASVDAMTASAKNATSAWAALGAMGAATAEKLEIARRMASASAVIAAPPVFRVDQAAAWAALSGQGAQTAQGLSVSRRMAAASAEMPSLYQIDQDAGWAALGGQGAAVYAARRVAQERAEAIARASAAIGTMGGPPASEPTAVPAGRAPFTKAQQANLGNLFQQGADVAVTGAMGMSPLMIALQQGPQIAQSFSGPGALKIGEIFSAAGEKAGALAARVGLVGGAIGGLTAAVVTAVAAQQSYSNTQDELARRLSGVGRASGVTAGQINALAPSIAEAGNISVRSAREIAGELASTGRIGKDMLGGLSATVKDYAATTGQEMPDAAKSLAAAFADPAKGADMLNKQLGFLDAATRENVQTLAAQGDRLGAQKALFDAYKGSLTSATELTSGWAKVTSGAGKAISDAWDAIGRSVDRALTGGDMETRIADAERRLMALRALGPSGDLSAQDSIYNVGGSRDDEVRRLEQALAALRKQQQDRADAATKTDLNSRSTVVDDLVKQFNPADARVKQIEQSATRIRAELKEGVLDPDGRSARTATELEASARRIREDLTQGGTQFANAIREAQFGLKTVGFSPQAQRVAGINERAENEIRALQTDPNDPLLRDYQVNAIRERARIEQETARQQAIYDTSSGSGRYRMGLGQAPEQYRNLYYEAATRYGVNPDLLVSQGYQESRFKTNLTSPAGAQGIAQFMPDTARGYGLTNPFDPAASIDAQARLMRDLLKEYNGDEVSALVGYNASTKVRNRFQASGRDTSVLPDETQKYIKAILTPPPNAEAQIKAQVERNEGLESEQRKLEATTRYLDRSGLAYDEAQRAEQMLSAARSAGIPITKEYEAQIRATASGMASSARLLAGTQAGRGLEFERDQLGRTRIDQAAYGRARGIYGDVTSPEAQAYIVQSRDNADLYEAKASITDAMSGFVTSIRRGGNALDALSSALGSIADRFLNRAVDGIVSSGFDAVLKSGGGSGGIGGFFASIFGGAKADGGLLTGPGGPRSDNLLTLTSPGEYVVSAAAVSHYGASLFDRLNRRAFPAYADGGLVPYRASLPQWMPPPANSAGNGGLTVNIANNAGAQVSAEEKPDGRGGRRLEVTIDEATATAVSRPGSRTRQALSRPMVATR